MTPHRIGRRGLLVAALGTAFTLGFASFANAQEFPQKAIRFVVGFAAGGPTDVLARIIAQDVSDAWKSPVVVENRAGANSIIATEFVARAAPDGYTLTVSTLSHNVNPILNADKAKYHPLKDFSPIVLVALLPMVAVVGNDSPVSSIQDLVARAKASPGTVSYGSAGNGGSAHLAAALLATRSNTDMTHVPFKGNAPALTEVVAGRVTFMFYPMVGISDLVAQKRVKALAVTTEKRHPDYPGVPTMAEVGFPGFEEYTQGIGFLAPAGTPVAVVNKLNEGIRASITKPETREKLRALGAIVVGSTPAEFAKWLEGDAERWARVIKAANVKGD